MTMIKKVFGVVSGVFSKYSLYITGGLIAVIVGLWLYTGHLSKKYDKVVGELAATEVLLSVQKANAALWQQRYMALEQRLRAYKQVEEAIKSSNETVSTKTTVLKEKAKAEVRKNDEEVDGYAMLLDGFISLRNIQKDSRNN